MVFGYIAVIYFIFSVYIIWFGKKKPEKIWVRFIYSFLVIVFILLLTNFSFSPQVSYKIKSFPFNLDREYSQIIEVEDYSIVVYPTNIDTNTYESYDIYTFHKFLGGYIEYQIRPGFSLFRNDETNQQIAIKSIIIEKTSYFLLYNRDLAKYDSLVIGDQTVDLDIDLSNPFVLFKVINNDDEPLVITVDGLEYINPFPEEE